MNPDLILGLVLYGALLVFYRWNEPKAREQDRKHGPRCPYFNFIPRDK